MTIHELLNIRLNAHVLLTLPKADTMPVSSATTALQQLQFLEALPAEFDRQTYTEIATAIGINPRTADRIICRHCDTGQIENVSHGKYLSFH